MNKKKNNLLALLFVGAVFFLADFCLAQQKFDSMKVKMPRHYFQTVILVDGYHKPDQELTDKTDFIGSRLKTYGVKQSVISISAPVFTHENRSRDSSIRSNTHCMLTFNRMSFRPQFSGINDHNLIKSGVGIRIIHNTGKKGVWFFDVSPFVTRDASYPDSKPYYRMSNTIVYSYNSSNRLNWRLGITKSFLWGNRMYLPFIGFRIGQLDKVNFSIQFPRNMSLNFPISDKFRLSVYTKPQGGMWNFSNYDSLYTIKGDATFHFTRYEINSGLRIDGSLFHWFNYYVAMGLSSKNNITFYSNNKNENNKNQPYKIFFYRTNLPSTLFLNIGVVYHFGKTKSFFNNRNMYDAHDINNNIGAGDNNVNNGNMGIPVIRERERADTKLKGMQDLIDYNDF